jgi:dihydropteroate synthase
MTINCKGQLIDLSQPKVMDFKYYPDSFFDGGKFSNESEIISQVKKC